MESLTDLSCAQLAAAIRERRPPAWRRWKRCSSAPARCSRGSIASCASTKTQRSPLRISPTGDRARLRARPAARRADGAQGHVLPARRGFDLRLEDRARRRPPRARRRCSSTSTPPARSSSAFSTWRSSPWGRPATTGTTATAAIPGTPSASPAARRRARAPRWRARRVRRARLGHRRLGAAARRVLRHRGHSPNSRPGLGREHPAALPIARHGSARSPARWKTLLWF